MVQLVLDMLGRVVALAGGCAFLFGLMSVLTVGG